MNIRSTITAALVTVVLLATAGCAVSRGQQTVGAYIDDTAITANIKARFVDNTQVGAAAISVETLNGTVMLAGFAKNSTERTIAEAIARDVNGVKAVRNEIAVRP